MRSGSQVPYLPPGTTQHFQAQKQDPSKCHSRMPLQSPQLDSCAAQHWTDGVVKSKSRVPKWPLWSLLSPLGQYLSPLPIPGNISGDLLVGTVDKNNGVRAGHIAASDNGEELQAEGPEHGVCQERGCQDLHSGKRKAQISRGVTSSPPASSSRLEPALGNMLLSPLPTHKIIPRICIEL